MALMVAQPITSAWAQSSESTSTQSSTESGDRSGGGEGFFRGHPDRIVLALGGLAAVILGLATVSKGNNNNNDPRPTSP
jgi:hypothetical protein